MSGRVVHLKSKSCLFLGFRLFLRGVALFLNLFAICAAGPRDNTGLTLSTNMTSPFLSNYRDCELQRFTLFPLRHHRTQTHSFYEMWRRSSGVGRRIWKEHRGRQRQRTALSYFTQLLWRHRVIVPVQEKLLGDTAAECGQRFLRCHKEKQPVGLLWTKPKRSHMSQPHMSECLRLLSLASD